MKGLKLILELTCATREANRLNEAYETEHERRLSVATRALQIEMQRNGNDVIKAAKKIFHKHCLATGHCTINDEFEKAVLLRLSTQEPVVASLVPKFESFGNNLKELSLKRELDRALSARNAASYQLIQQYFARAHAKRVVLGENALDPTERLLCDYPSVVELKIASDPDMLFAKVTQWLRSRKQDCCRACGKSTKKKGIKCGKCGLRCFCSIVCQVEDESNRVFCHDHECITQLKDVY